MHRLNILLSLFLLPTLLTAGRPPGGEDDILRPVPFTLHVGPYIGGAWIASNGTFETLCQCEYSGGNGLGFQLGVFADYPLTREVSLMATLGLRSMHPAFDKKQTRIEFIQFPPEDGDFTNVDFELETVLQMTLIELGVYGRWQLPVRGLYFAAGGEFGVVIDDNIREMERILTPGVVYDLGGGNEQESMDGPLSRYYDDTGYRLAAAVKLGYVIPLTETISIAPEAGLSFPLTPIVSNFQDWRQSAFQAIVFLRFAI
jgi:hypothetical protein